MNECREPIVAAKTQQSTPSRSLYTTPSGLRRDLTTYKPTDALQYTWDSRNEDQRRWLRQTLADHGVAITDFIVDRHQPSR